MVQVAPGFATLQRPFLRRRLDLERHSTGSVGPRLCPTRRPSVSLVEAERRGGRGTDNSRRTAGEGGCHTTTAQHKAPEDERSGENGSETGQRSIRACRLCNSCPELRLESCKASRTARGMTETWTDAAMDWPRQPRLRNHGPKYRNLDRSLSRRGLTSCATARKQMREGVGLSVERPPSFCAAGRTALSAQASRTKGWCSGPGD